MAPDAPHEVVRAAYRRAAREHHPDASRADAADRMAAINAAWHVLGNAQRRAAYDRELRASRPVTSSTSARPAPTPPPLAREPRFNPFARYQDPPRFPWRPMIVIGVLGAVAVIASSATRTTPPPLPVDNVLRTGDCVTFEANGDAAEADCAGPHDGVVDALVPSPEACRVGTEAHRDRQGMGTACVVIG